MHAGEALDAQVVDVSPWGVRSDGFESPLVGKSVQTRGIVTASNVGFSIQPEDAVPGEATGGLLVRTRHTGQVRPGDVVEVQGRVHE